jgi:hypothetical protein
MTSSPDDDPTIYTENGPLLPSSIYAMESLRSGSSQHRDELNLWDMGNPPVSQTGEVNHLATWLNRILCCGSKDSGERVFDAASRWVKGPQPPQPFAITPILSQFQTAPTDYLHSLFPRRKHKLWLFAIFHLLWAAVFLGALSISISGCQVTGYSSPVRLSCASRFW